MKTKNQMTSAEADKIYHKYKNRCPSKALQEYVHERLMHDAHFMFQYKEDGIRYGYCSHCQKTIQLEKTRMLTPEQREILSAKHGEKVLCPKCHIQVEKRHAGKKTHWITAKAAEFIADDNGALIGFWYNFRYEYEKNHFKIKPQIYFENILYFDIHKYFHLLWGGYSYVRIHFDDTYSGGEKFQFTLKDRLIDPKNAYDREPIHCFGLYEAVEKSNLKYCCVNKIMEQEPVCSRAEFEPYPAVSLVRFLKFYSSYPEATEKLIKEGFEDVVREHIRSTEGITGCFNYRGKTCKEFLRCDKEHLKFLKEQLLYTSFYGWTILTVQFMQSNQIPLTKENYQFWYDSSFAIYNKELFILLRKYLSSGKIKKYFEEQEKNYAHRKFLSIDTVVRDYNDYLKICKNNGYAMTKEILLPQNLYESHQQQIEAKAQKEVQAKEEKVQKFRQKELPKLQKKYAFETSEYLIRPAEGYADMKKESDFLHHCVYSCYAEDYLVNRKTDILFIRTVSKPEIPFFTVEFKKGMLIQCRGLRNCSYPPEIKAFLEEWQNWMKNKNKRNRKKEVAA